LNEVAPRGRTLRTVRIALALAIAVLGVALLTVTISRGGGELGIVLGTLFTLLGVGRLYLLRGR
jgi:hypothetical protein